MKGLLYNEFVRNRKNLLILLGLMIFISLMRLGDDSADTEIRTMIITLISIFCDVLVFFFLIFFQSEFFRTDESRRWASFALSAPKGAEDIVRSKYLFILAVTFAAAALCYELTNIYISVLGVFIDDTTVIILMFYTNIFLSAVEIPFIMRFGTTTGNIYRSVLLCAVLFGAAIYGLFGDLSIFGSPENFAEKIVTFLSSEEMPSGFLLFLGVFPFLSMGLYYASYRLSCKLYKKGVENYDR